MKEDLERMKKWKSDKTAASLKSSQSEESSESSESSPVKELIDKFLIADFFFVLFILAWLGVGAVQASSNGGSSIILDAWFPLWPLLWQPAIGILMAGALVSGGLNWIEDKKADN
eukprot:gene31304-biopygen6171